MQDRAKTELDIGRVLQEQHPQDGTTFVNGTEWVTNMQSCAYKDCVTKQYEVLKACSTEKESYWQVGVVRVFIQ